FVKSPRVVYRETCLYWNRVRTCVPGWPNMTIAVPGASRRYALEWSDFPATLQLDVEAYLNRTGDLFADDYAPPARPRMIARTRGYLRPIATALVRSGHAAETITDLSVLVRLENAKLALRFFLDRAGKKTSAVHSMATLLARIARHWVKFDEKKLKPLREMSR